MPVPSTTHILPGNVLTLLSATGQSTESGTGSTSLVGDWYRVVPEIGKIYVSSILTGTSVLSTATASISIQGSNDGSNPSSTDLLTFSAQALTTDTVILGAAIPSSLEGSAYIRANLTSLTTATAGSTGNGSNVVIRLHSLGIGGRT